MDGTGVYSAGRRRWGIPYCAERKVLGRVYSRVHLFLGIQQGAPPPGFKASS